VFIPLVVLAPLGCAVRAVEPDASGSTSTDEVTGSSAETTDGIEEEGTHEEGGRADTDGTADSDSTGPDRDGDADLMFFDGLVSEPYLYWNLGNGSFADPVSMPYTGRPDVAPIQLDDHNADELFVPNWHSEEGNVVQVAATLETVTTLALPACYTANSATGDLNGDGLDDLVATGDCNSPSDYLPLATYHNTGGDTLELSQEPYWQVGDSLSGSDVLLLDVDHDDDLDVVAATSETLVLAVNLGDGTFAEAPGLIPFESTVHQRIVPVDAGGGTVGLVIETHVGFPVELTASLVVPNDTWDSATISGLDLQGSVVDGTDFDNDGRTDLAVLLGADGHLGIWVSGD